MNILNSKKNLFLTIAIISVLVAIPLTIFATLNSRDQRSKAAAGGGSVNFNNGNYFLLGANYPWQSYGNDFGQNGYGSYGVHTGGAYTTDFADMKTKGVHVVRWFVFEDGRAGITFDSAGNPTGVDSAAYSDLDAALTLAKNNNIYLNLVFLDFTSLFAKTSLGSGVYAGGHKDIFTDSTKASALLTNVINPVMDHVAASPNAAYILSWEAMNEPEWVISDLPGPALDGRANGGITMQQFWTYAANVANAVHSKTKSLFTIGSACLKWNKVWTNAFASARSLPLLNIDYYQTHYYQWMDGNSSNDSVLGVTNWSPLVQNAGSLNLDKPIIVGEAPDINSISGCNGNCAEKILANGFAGYWPWSYRYQNTSDKFQISWSTYTSFESAHATIVKIPPPGTATTTGDTTPPVVSITSPTNGAAVSGTVNITATASDNVGVTKVEFYVDGSLKSTSTTAPYTYSLNTTTVVNGNHTVLAKAYDAANNITNGSVTLTVNNTVVATHVLSLVSPSAGATLIESVTLQASALTGSAVNNVEFFVDGVSIGKDTTSPFSLVWNSKTVGNGPHKISVKPLDVVGLEEVVNVTVANTNVLPGSLTATYFTNQTLSGTAAYTVGETAINHDWGYNAPDTRIPADHFSVRWTVSQNFEAAKYRFNATADDGIRIFLDGNLVKFTNGTSTIDGWRNQPATTYNAIVDMTSSPGTHTVKVEYFENTGQAVAKVNWVKAATCFDMDGDNAVTDNDLGVVANYFGAHASNLPWDVNGDNYINVLDLSRVASKRGTSCS